MTRRRTRARSAGPQHAGARASIEKLRDRESATVTTRALGWVFSAVQRQRGQLEHLTNEELDDSHVAEMITTMTTRRRCVDNDGIGIRSLGPVMTGIVGLLARWLTRLHSA